MSAPDRMAARERRWLLLLLLAFAAIRLTLFLGDFEIQVSRTTTDAGPVAIAHYVHAPQEFAQDAEMRLGYRMWLASMLHWLTVLGYEGLGVAPETSALVLVYLQTLLLAWAMFSLALAFGQSAWAAGLISLFVLSFDPQFFNLANYGELLWMPYAGHLALPFLLFGFSALVSDRRSLSYAFLLIGGLVHAVLGVQAAVIASIYVLARNRWSVRQSLRDLAVIGGCVLVMLLPSRLAVIGIDRLSPQEMYGLVSSVWHQVPWLAGAESFTDKIAWVLTKVAVASAVVFWACTKTGANVRRLWISVLLGSLLLVASNVLGVALGSTELLQLSGFRATTFVILLSLPFFFQAVLERVALPDSNGRAGIVMGLVAGGAGVLAAHAIPQMTRDMEMGIISALLLADVLWQRFLPAVRVWPRLLLIGAVTAVAVNESLRGLASLSPDFHVSAQRVVAFTVIALLLGWIIHWAATRKFKFRASAPILAACVGITSVASALAHGRSTTTGIWESIFQAQKWARQSTAPGRGFILMDRLSPFQSWRSFSRRPVVSQAALSGSQYFYSHEMIQYAERLSLFYGMSTGRDFFRFDADGENLVRKEMIAAFRNFDEDRILAFAREFGGDYLIRKSGERDMKFPVAFRNDYVVIYELGRPGSAK